MVWPGRDCDDLPGLEHPYMSVEFHYYQPWSYAGDCTYDYWGEIGRAHV